MKLILVLFSLMIMLVAGEPPKPVYGPPKTSGGGGYTGGGGSYAAGGDDEVSAPANYEFSYEVQDDKAGLNFGHMESRQDETAKGSYHVLLPDGRTQKVDYVADQDGYKPQVTYDGEARPDSFGPPGGSGGRGGGKTGGGSGDTDGGGYRY